MSKNVSVLMLYAREDRHLFETLDKHLYTLKTQNFVDTWHVQDIGESVNWQAGIDIYLDSAQIILLLISPNFINSMGNQMSRVFMRDAHVIPIILRPTDLKNTAIGELGSLPDDGQPVTSQRNKDEAFLNIVNAIRILIEREHVASTREALDTEERAVKQSFLWPFNIPDERYYPLPMREQNLQEYASQLLDQEKERILVISGLGGLGKTSISVELARRILKPGQFVGIIGDSAKQERLVGGQIISLPDATLNLADFLNSIADQMEIIGIRTLEQERKIKILASHLRQHPYLILADNLETFENLEETVDSLNRMLGRGKSHAIITSRNTVKHDAVLSRRLQGLELEDSLFFLREETERTGNHRLGALQEEQLIEIHKVTDGAPLAMKLVASQLVFFELDDILYRLKQAQGQELLLYKFIFQQVWEQLSFVAKKILISIGKTVSTTISWQDLIAAQFADDVNTLQDAIKQLVTYSLIDPSSGEQLRYGIHPLTRHFVTSTLPEIWNSNSR